MFLSVILIAVASICPLFGTPVSGEGYDHHGELFIVTPEVGRYLSTLDTSNDFWVGYENGGFDRPSDETLELIATMYLSTGEERQIEITYSPTMTDRYYVYAFRDTSSYADRYGEHYGQHPCKVFWITAEQYSQLRQQLYGE